MKSVWVLVLDGVMDSSLSITLDLLRAARSIAGASRAPVRFDIRILAARTQVTTGCGLTLRADARFRDALADHAAPDWVIVPAMGE